MVTIEDLFKKHQSVQNVGFSGDAYKPGLARMVAFDAIVGCPWKKFRSVHVAGTNGKGSVSSMLASALASSGLRTGLYTSPHLKDFRERMRIVGHGMIPEDKVEEFLSVYERQLDPLSFFEITTEMAFWWFASEGVDIAVIETGLGGRLDSTNIITPQLSVITSIGLDHCAILGDTLGKIAFEKAGIFKKSVPAVVASREKETEKVFEKVAESIPCSLVFADQVSVYGEDGFEVDERAVLARMDLQGPCQAQNLHTALVCLSELGVKADLEAIERTAELTCFRGRWERLCLNPEVICDIGHNPQALEINFARLKQTGRPLFIVYGVMADKDVDSIAAFMPDGARYYLCAPHTERSLDVERLQNRLKALRPALNTVTAPSVEEAVRMAVADAGRTDDSLVYIGGSTFVVSESLKCF